MYFNILTFYSYISGVYFCCFFVIVLGEINVQGVSFEMCEKGYYIWPNAQYGPIVKDIGYF